jgi:pentatricopeptide repeat protein
MPPATPVEVYNTVREAIARENTVPSPDAIGRLITQLARAGEEAKARELYQLAQVVLASCVPDPQQQAEAWRSVEDNMIAACCFLGQLEQAGMHRARIIEAGMAPSADAYATMIASSRDSTDDALVARELFDESQSLGVVPHLYLFNTIISKLSKARKAEMALDLFQHMKSAGIRPSSVTYGAVINACCRVGDAESAETLFDEMVKQPNFKPRVPPFK